MLFRTARAFSLVVTVLLSTLAYGQTIEKGAFPERRIGGLEPDVTVEIFLDLQCPACANFFTRNLLDRIKKHAGDRVVVIVRHFPLTLIHDDAFLAACAVEAAALQGKYVEMILKILSEQANWVQKQKRAKRHWTESPFSISPTFNRSVRAKFIRYAGQLGIDKRIFRDDLESAFVRQRVFDDVSRARSLSVNATPTVLFNGKQIGFERLSDLPEIIEEELKK